jgi:NAD+ kinase
VVKELAAEDDVNIMLHPDVAAKLSHYYSVDNNKILLFDPKAVPGFGGNHLPIDSTQYSFCSSMNDDEEEYEMNDHPDLVCTLGGDGLLMYASSLFSGPCPPILCVAGGSLGFLTPFSRCEMVDAIRISLGLDSTKDNAFRSSSGNDNAWLEEPMPKLPTRTGGEKSIEKLDVDNGRQKRPKVKFGANNLICLSMRMRLDCCVVNREGVVRARFSVLNEVVIDRGSSPYLAALECFCDDVHLTTVQADGVIFST